MQAYLLNGLVVPRFTTMTHLSQFIKDKINLNSMLIVSWYISMTCILGVCIFLVYLHCGIKGVRDLHCGQTRKVKHWLVEIIVFGSVYSLECFSVCAQKCFWAFSGPCCFLACADGDTFAETFYIMIPQ